MLRKAKIYGDTGPVDREEGEKHAIQRDGEHV